MVYDDRKGTEIGTCTYDKACSIISEHLDINKKYLFGLSQKMLNDLNIDTYKKNIEEQQTTEEEQTTFTKQKYFNARRTPQEDAELRREIMKENNEIRRQERQVIEKSNGNKIQVNTKRIK